MTVTFAGELTEHEVRSGLRHLARTWDQPVGCQAHTVCIAAAEVTRDEVLAYLTSPHLPPHAPGARCCDCLGCLWDEFRGALDMLDSYIGGTLAWQDVAPEYGDSDDPEWQAQFDLEMRVNGLLRDLMYGPPRGRVA
jgi:hypothetical protein